MMEAVFWLILAMGVAILDSYLFPAMSRRDLPWFVVAFVALVSLVLIVSALAWGYDELSAWWGDR